MQPGKCLYTTIRELVENSLDAAESISQLPDIEVTMCVPWRLLVAMRSMPAAPSCLHACLTGHGLRREEMSQRRLNDIRGVENHERLDEELYQDFETEADRKVHCRQVSKLRTTPSHCNNV